MQVWNDMRVNDRIFHFGVNYPFIDQDFLSFCMSLCLVGIGFLDYTVSFDREGNCHVLTHARTDYDPCVWQSGWGRTSAH